jgi:hypothetical protein
MPQIQRIKFKWQFWVSKFIKFKRKEKVIELINFLYEDKNEIDKSSFVKKVLSFRKINKYDILKTKGIRKFMQLD